MWRFVSTWFGGRGDAPPRPIVVAAVVFAVVFAVALGAVAVHDRQRGDGFSVARWELTTVANRWLYLLGEPLRDDPAPDEAIARYFALTDRSTREAERLENVVEAAIEGRIAAVAREAGLADDPWGPLPGWLLGPLALLPPVDIEFSGSPTVLVRSPRDEVRRLSTRLLAPGLDSATAEALEAQAERSPNVSALVVGTGGVATYPAVVRPRASYPATVEVAAHEWLHHYLAPYPLGRAYFSSSAAETINETVADIAAADLARAVLERFGDPTAPAPGAQATTPRPLSGVEFDRDRVLRDLRVEVDALLAAGNIARAERRMAETERRLDAAGVGVGRINQAFFAWFGTYATRGDATDPLGEQLRALREATGDVGRFLRTVRSLDTRAEVARTLAEATSGSSGPG